MEVQLRTFKTDDDSSQKIKLVSKFKRITDLSNVSLTRDTHFRYTIYIFWLLVLTVSIVTFLLETKNQLDNLFHTIKEKSKQIEQSLKGISIPFRKLYNLPIITYLLF